MLDRQLIRQAVVTKLLNTTDAQDRVFDSRIDPLMHQFPSISVYTLAENRTSVFSSSPLELKVNVELSISLVVKALADGDYMTALDTLCEQTLAQLDYTLGDTVESCIYSGTTIDLHENGECYFAVADLKFDCVVYQSEAKLIDPVALPRLNTINMQWDMADPNNGAVVGSDGQIDATDNLTGLYALSPRQDVEQTLLTEGLDDILDDTGTTGIVLR